LDLIGLFLNFEKKNPWTRPDLTRLVNPSDPTGLGRIAAKPPKMNMF
jgi:hypothetical protein